MTVFNGKRIGLMLMLVAGLAGCSSAAIQQSQPDHLVSARYGHAAVQVDQRIFTLAGANYSGFLSDVEIYDTATGKTERWADKLIPRRFFTAVWDGQHSIYILGGLSKRSAVSYGLEDKVEVLDTVTGEVKIISRMPQATSSNTAVMLDGKIVVFGGERFLSTGVQAPSNMVLVYDVATNSWTKAADMPVAKSSRAVVNGEWIYLVGGYDQKKALQGFDRFNLARNEWQQLADIPVRLSAHSATVWHDKLLTFGDYDKMSSAYSYDFEKAQWQKLALDYKASRHNAAVTVNNEVFVIGGATGSDGPFLDYIQKFSF